jgi:hypothetical protein
MRVIIVLTFTPVIFPWPIVPSAVPILILPLARIFVCGRRLNPLA